MDEKEKTWNFYTFCWSSGLCYEDVAFWAAKSNITPDPEMYRAVCQVWNARLSADASGEVKKGRN